MNNQPREDALAIWMAGLNAVRSETLVRRNVRRSPDELVVGGVSIPLDSTGRIVVVGAGKAGAGMSAALEEALGETILRAKQVTGWVNVPAGCERDLQAIHLHAARPAGVNEPTQAGVEGAEKILELVSSLNESDVCICLLSGGGSALLPAPRGVSLADKQAVTRFLSSAGANIGELNTVRKQLSRIKGGGLARACRAGKLITLIISDVIGNPIDVIASGPTVENTTTASDAMQVLEKYDGGRKQLSPAIYQALESTSQKAPSISARVANVIIGDNAVAVSAAADEARRLGYRPLVQYAEQLEGDVADVAREHAAELLKLRQGDSPTYDCFISGGEPTVTLAPADFRGKGGRNQQLALAIAQQLLEYGDPESWRGLAFISGGTDGEDGPTTAAGAMLYEAILQHASKDSPAVEQALATNDAYNWFASTDGLLETGPTNTNVCDLRVGLLRRP